MCFFLLFGWVGGVYGVKGAEGDDAGSTWLHRFDGQA